MNVSQGIMMVTLIIIIAVMVLRCYVIIDTLIYTDNYGVIAGLVTLPLMVLFVLFPIQYTMSLIVAWFLPTSYLSSNSQYFSCEFGKEEEAKSKPKVTIQLPIYDEDFHYVIRPTLRQCVAMRDEYNSNFCNIVVNDDGICKFVQDKLDDIVHHPRVATRLRYYKKYDLGFTARQYANRPGRFKKASNMNFSYNVAQYNSSNGGRPIRTFDVDLNSPPQPKRDIPIVVVDLEKEQLCSGPKGCGKNEEKKEKNEDKQPIPDYSPNNAKQQNRRHHNVTFDFDPIPFMATLNINHRQNFLFGGDIEFGDFILIIDSDTTLPSGQVLRQFIAEFENNESLAYLQCATLPLETSYQNYFGSFIAHFTKNLYQVAFRLCCRNGDIAPLIGHNIIVRKSALMALHNEEQNGETVKYWREDRVSEDFDLCLRLHQHGYHGKYVIHHSDGYFGEGVSLSYEDEMAKYSKFAYGASEVMFQPVGQWCKKGILTQGIKVFFSSDNVPWTSKIGIISYLMTYFSIASAIPFAPLIYIIQHFVEKWEMIFFHPVYALLFLVVLFTFFSPCTNWIIRRRCYPQDTGSSLCHELLLGGFFAVFYSGISYSIFVGVVSHLFNLNISWGSTVKSLEQGSSKLTECYRIIVHHRCQMMYSILLIILMIIFPFDIVSALPILSLALGHILAPFILNPVVWGCNNFQYDTTDTPSARQ
jgi:cellulose synthase/poly-beta-1,6-N-acetylglucosamine synthase-like glycosyltransferase